MTKKAPKPGWNPVAIRSHTGQWDALPNAPWTVDEAYSLASAEVVETRQIQRNGRNILEVRAI